MTHKTRRSLAWLMSAVCLFALLSSALFLVEEADHHCTGQDCLICACLQGAQHTLSQLGAGSTGTAGHLLPLLLVLLAGGWVASPFRPCSPVRQKVKMNN